MKRTDYNNNGGLQFAQNRMAFMQTGYNEAFGSIAKVCGDKTILHGVVKTGSNVSDGWIAVGGELVRFIGGAYQAQVIVSEQVVTNMVFADNVARDVHFDKTATLASAGGFAFSELKRMDTLLLTLLTSMKAYCSYAETGRAIGDVNVDGFINIFIPDQGTADYIVHATLVSFNANYDYDNDVIASVKDKTAISFKLLLRDVSATNINDLKVDFTIHKKYI